VHRVGPVVESSQFKQATPNSVAMVLDLPIDGSAA